MNLKELLDYGVMGIVLAAALWGYWQERCKNDKHYEDILKISLSQQSLTEAVQSSLDQLVRLLGSG